MSTEARTDLEGWIKAFRGPLIGLLASWGADWRTAEELAQEVFAEAWMGRERLRADPAKPDYLGAVGAWLRGIAFHLWSMERRRVDKREQPLGAESTAETPGNETSEERRTLLVRAFAELSGAHQTVLRMHYLEQTSAREVAALLGLTPKAVESRLYQARKVLRARVEHIAGRAAEGVQR